MSDEFEQISRIKSPCKKQRVVMGMDDEFEAEIKKVPTVNVHGEYMEVNPPRK